MNASYTIPEPVSVFIVEDSAFMRLVLKRIIESDPAFRVVGVAADGEAALGQIHVRKPDVVTLDVEMPGWDGLTTLKRIMAESPRPVIMVSAYTPEGAESSLEALEAGAFDCIPKPASREPRALDSFQAELLANIKAARENFQQLQRHCPMLDQGTGRVHGGTFKSVAPRVIAIGCSTGGPKALQTMLPMLPSTLPVPILIVQHMPLGFTAPFAERLNRLCQLRVREGQQGDRLEEGTVYIAPAGHHMRVCGANSVPMLQLSPPEPDALHVPSVDVMMKSVAAEFRATALGIILTGMGQDGLLGMTAIAREGGLTLGQDEASCAVYGMPRSCAEAGMLRKIAPLTAIPELVLQAVSGWRWH
jgi:two-component system chemotaxis response regulator CheB